MVIIFGLLMMAVFGILRANDEFVPKIPAECMKQGYCENVPGYPEAHASKLVTVLGDKSEYLVDERADLTEPVRNNPNEVPLCRAIRKNIIPQAAQDIHGKWHFVLNPKNNRLVRYSVEICGQEQEPCAVARFGIGYTANCSQKYVERIAPVIDIKGDLMQKHVKFPCDCYCKVVSRNSIASATILLN